GAAAAVGAGTLPRAATTVPAGRPDVPQLQAARRAAAAPAAISRAVRRGPQAWRGLSQQPYGVQFVEDRELKRIFVLIGSGNSNYRIIQTDGRTHAGQVGGDDDNPLYYGRSVAKWEGDSLVADTRGFNEDFWFTNGGLPHTEQLRLIEKFTRADFDTLKYEVTIEDSGAYTRPWS